jgi:hypothetical protein
MTHGPKPLRRMVMETVRVRKRLSRPPRIKGTKSKNLQKMLSRVLKAAMNFPPKAPFLLLPPRKPSMNWRNQTTATHEPA